ncbi:cation:proton antiporter [Membranihabitans maritimus]|uniref:cation:proton antiporter n=1 Tax=Membranihabitans maritimus TaxID=2904244 RepID=UPI001F4459B5|nr:cation:proton antiporter [Membranihabitans maritimus]
MDINIPFIPWALAGLQIDITIYLLVAFVILMLSFALKQIKQPYILAYMMCGIVLGPSGTESVTNLEMVQNVGDIGLIILMFFIGMEISLPNFIRKWRIAVLGTGLQMILSIVLCGILGMIFHWSIYIILFLGFIIAFSSSAVVIKMIEDHPKIKKFVGKNVIIILLTQDILFVPILIFLSNIAGNGISNSIILMQVTGGILLLSILLYVLWKGEIKLPFSRQLENDHELQVFAGLFMCFGLAFLTDFFHLSAALGAFVGGIIVHSSKSTEWLHDSLHSFRVVLVAVFFISIGILIDINFLVENWSTVLILVLFVFITNHGINTLSLRSLGNSRSQSIYGGGLLAQIGELSFILASEGRASGVLSMENYNLTILIISVTIFLSPFWILLTKSMITRYSKDPNIKYWME